MDESLATSIVNSFRQASRELGFCFEPNFVVSIPNGAHIATLGLVRDFGSSLGALLFCQGFAPSASQQASLKTAGYFWSELYPSYAEFAAPRFVDTLNDWGFYGKQSDQPVWFTGEPWSR